MRGMMFGGVAALGVLVALPAQAGPLACQWEHLPQAKRDQVFALYDRDLESGMRNEVFTEEDRKAAAAACNIRDDEASAVGLPAYEIEAAMSRLLGRTRGVTQAQLDRAWPDVAGLVMAALTLTDAEQRVRALAAAVAPFGRAIGIPEAELNTRPPSQAMNYIFAYLRARGRREQMEARIAGGPA